MAEILPEDRVILLGLIRREKQRLLGKPVDPPPKLSKEDQLIVLDILAEKLMKGSEEDG